MLKHTHHQNDKMNLKIVTIKESKLKTEKRDMSLPCLHIKKAILQANLGHHNYIQPNQFLVNFDLEIVEILANIFVFWGVSSK